MKREERFIDFCFGSYREMLQIHYLPVIEIYSHRHGDKKYGNLIHFHVLFQFIFWYAEIQVGRYFKE